MRTRAVKAKSKPSSQPEDAGPQLQASDEKPPQVFILPKAAGSDARIVSLADPATSVLRRYLFCPSAGVYEFRKIAAPNEAPKSWLLNSGKGDDKDTTDTTVSHQLPNAGNDQHTEPSPSKGPDPSLGYVMRDADIFLATPIDPLFLLMPIFKLEADLEKRGRPRQFLCADDHLDFIVQTSKHMTSILKYRSFKDTLLRRLEHVSQTQRVGDEIYYKADPGLLVDELISKATVMTEKAWPSSLDSKFVSQPLDIPIITSGLHDTAESFEEPRSATTPSDSLDAENTEGIAKASCLDESPEDSQTPAISTTRSVPTSIANCLRTRTALNFIASSYLPKEMRDHLQNVLASNVKVDFKPLDTHLEEVKKLKREAHALRSLSENISRKRACDTDEAIEAQAEKKRRKEEEDKKKKAESRALKNLKKADTTGMKKLSSFFTKSAPAA